jgi:hypothetical protein
MTIRIVVKNVKDILAISSSIIESAKKEVLWLVLPVMLFYASTYGLNEQEKMFIQKGGRVRGIIDISYPYIDVIRERHHPIGLPLNHPGTFNYWC